MSLSADVCRREAFSAAVDMSFLSGVDSDFHNPALLALCEFVITADDASAVAAWSILDRIHSESEDGVSGED